MRYEDLWPDMENGSRRNDRDGAGVLKVAGALPCALCRQPTAFRGDMDDIPVCSQECMVGFAVYVFALVTGACTLDRLPPDEALAIIGQWTEDARRAAIAYLVGVQDSVMAGEHGDAFPPVACPECLKPYGGYDIAAVRAIE